MLAAVAAWGFWLAGAAAWAGATPPPEADALERAEALRAAGRPADAARWLQDWAQRHPAHGPALAAALGGALLESGRAAEAEPALRRALEGLDGASRAAVSNDLGLVEYGRRRSEAAAERFRETITAVPPGSALWLTASLNLARTRPPARRLDLLAALQPWVLDRAAEPDAPRWLVNLGSQSAALGKAGQALAHASLERARGLAAARGDLRLEVEALEGLGSLYEGARRAPDALALTDEALALAANGGPVVLDDLRLRLHWRRGRLLRALGDSHQALAAYQRAVEIAGALRQDLPIESLDGESSYRQVLEPLHAQYLRLALDALARTPGAQHPLLLTRVRDAVESLRQAEMQDFLGDRCPVSEEGATARLEPGVAVLYPLLLEDRVELLLETAAGLARRSVAQPGAQVRDQARDFAAAVRAIEPDVTAMGQALHAVLVAPVADLLTAQGVHTLVFVPEGELRLVPFAALHDGQSHLVQRLAVGSVISMGLTHFTPGSGRAPDTLLAGLSRPGGVAESLVRLELSMGAAGTRALGIGGGGGEGSVAERAERLRESLALPGVAREIAALGRTMPGRSLLDAQFSATRFLEEAATGRYRVVHIASHGVFGGSADTSFVLAHDELLGINRLQGMLRSEALQRDPIDLLTLSACQTAEGNDRAPLGIAGAAIRARARSVLGTLWPVEDNAARQVMEGFYRGLAGRLPKAEALRRAQVAVAADPRHGHPFFWAPFTLIGNWR